MDIEFELTEWRRRIIRIVARSSDCLLKRSPTPPPLSLTRAVVQQHKLEAITNYLSFTAINAVLHALRIGGECSYLVWRAHLQMPLIT